MPNESAPRATPLLPPEWNEAAHDALAAFPSSYKFVMSRWEAGGADARGMHVLGLMARHPPLAKAFMTLNAHVSGASTLAVRLREIVILRVSWLRFFEYEFVQHIILGRRAGLSDDEIERVTFGADAPGWTVEEASLIRAVDELHVKARIGDATWARLGGFLTTEQVMDLIFLVGCYDVLGMLINSFDIPLEPGVTPLDPALKVRMHAQPASRLT